MLRLKEKYSQEVVGKLNEEFNYSNQLSLPKVTKVTLNMGFTPDSVSSVKKIEDIPAAKELLLISGQKPVVTFAKQSIAAFKLRKGMPIGCKVTIRRDRMYDFLERLVYVALPRVRDFRGFTPKSFDGNGNFNFGIKEQIVFPEIDYDKVDKIRGLDICITTTATNDKEAEALLYHLGLPFINRNTK